MAEWIKVRSARIVWVTFIAFGLAPVMGGVFIVILSNPETMAQSGMLSTKARMVGFGADWNSYLGLLTQAMGVGGIMVFGFVASWLFGREYSDGTAKDLLALPASRTHILNAKFMMYIGWCLALAVSNLVIGSLIGLSLQVAPATSELVRINLSNYFVTTILTILPGTPIAFFAIWGKGYLPPLGFVALTLVFAQIIAATGYGSYFPWSVPGLYSGSGGEYKEQLDVWSYLIVVFTGLAGYLATILYWRLADQTK